MNDLWLQCRGREKCWVVQGTMLVLGQTRINPYKHSQARCWRTIPASVQWSSTTTSQQGAGEGKASQQVIGPHHSWGSLDVTNSKSGPASSSPFLTVISVLLQRYSAWLCCQGIGPRHCCQVMELWASRATRHLAQGTGLGFLSLFCKTGRRYLLQQALPLSWWFTL